MLKDVLSPPTPRRPFRSMSITRCAPVHNDRVFGHYDFDPTAGKSLTKFSVTTAQKSRIKLSMTRNQGSRNEEIAVAANPCSKITRSAGDE